MELPHGWPYKRDSIITVNRTTLRSVIRAAEMTLGLSAGTHNTSLEYAELMPDGYNNTGAYKGDGKFTLGSRSCASTVFHESVHYICDTAELLFAKRSLGLYEILIDELMPEFATMETYDFNHASLIPMDLISGDDINRIAMHYHKDFGHVESGVEFARRHRRIERGVDFAQIGEANPQMTSFYSEFCALPPESREHFYPMLAQHTASKALRAGFTAKEFFRFVKEVDLKEYPPSVIYFQLIDILKKAGVH